ncbi:MAG: arsenate reductase family protein [Planctomycetota bacterium]
MPAIQTTLTVYGYMKCDSCRKALKWLDAAGRDHTFIDITEQPPDASTLASALEDGRYDLKHLFNTSGQLYRSMNIKDKLPGMSRDEALALLADHGMLIKRPIITDGKRFTVGFKPAVFDEVWVSG